MDESVALVIDDVNADQYTKRANRLFPRGGRGVRTASRRGGMENSICSRRRGEIAGVMNECARGRCVR